MLLDGKSSDVIKEYACREKGMVTLWGDGMAKCKAGLTSLEEVLRIATVD
jgi:type II secretory ATPase GspE/PulE/Tfp pilus assembly ATPase PilB-like protein